MDGFSLDLERGFRGGVDGYRSDNERGFTKKETILIWWRKGSDRNHA